MIGSKCKPRNYMALLVEVSNNHTQHFEGEFWGIRTIEGYVGLLVSVSAIRGWLRPTNPDRLRYGGTVQGISRLIHPIKYYRDYLNVNIRPDGREFDKLRPNAVNVGSITTADGSAIVKVGNTNIVCGIRAELAKPKPSEPDQGFLVPSIELTPLCSPKYRTNSSSNEDAELYSAALNDILINADCIDLKKLCIAKEKLVWCLYCDISCLDHDGCIVDAALIAVVAALRNLRLPKVSYEVETERISVDTSVNNKIEVKASPVSTTLMVFDDNVIITDPTSEEENLSSCILTVAVCNGEVCYIMKPGGTPFNENQMGLCIKRALEREKSVLKLLRNVLR